MGQSIYNIEKTYIDLVEQIIEAGGEITEEQEQALALNKETLEVKAVKYGYVIKTIDDDIASIDAEIARLSALKSVRSNLKEKLKDTVSQAMILYGIEEIKLQNLKINFRKSQSVSIYDETLIPEEYKVTKEVTSISKAEISKVLKAGGEVNGATLDTNQNIQFK